MDNVDLGVLEPCSSWQAESRLFPSKVGGKPAWLDLEGIPFGSDLICSLCEDPMIFLCQIYAPYEEDDENFHRTLFIFVCRKSKCCIRNKSDNIRIFRSNLKRDNKFYSFDPPKNEPDPNFSLSKWLTLCKVCGCLGDKKCSKCKNVTYCHKNHQIIDWKQSHKEQCGVENDNSSSNSKLLFPEFEVLMETEILDSEKIDEEKEKLKYESLLKEGKLGTMSNISEEELAQHSTEDSDKTFTKFRDVINNYPEQVLRYSRGGTPLFISNENKPLDIPNCEYCNGSRQFEFQIMPQILSFLHENELDWGVLLFYTCEKSCDGSTNYKREYVYKQDVSLTNI